MDKLQKIREALKAATPGPWIARRDKWPGNSNLQYWVENQEDGFACAVRYQDAHLIANARDWLFYLLSELDAKDKEIQTFNNFKKLIQGDFEEWVESSWTDLQRMYRENKSLQQRLKQAEEAMGNFVQRCVCDSGKSHLQDTIKVDCPRCTWARNALSLIRGEVGNPSLKRKD